MSEKEVREKFVKIFSSQLERGGGTVNSLVNDFVATMERYYKEHPGMWLDVGMTIYGFSDRNQNRNQESVKLDPTPSSTPMTLELYEREEEERRKRRRRRERTAAWSDYEDHNTGGFGCGGL